MASITHAGRKGYMLRQHCYLQPPVEAEAITMEFRLAYRGPLAAARGNKTDNRAPQKQAIRKYLHPQLKEWWKQNQRVMGNPEVVANNFDEFGFRFVPVVSAERSYNCSIDILFLRRDSPGNLIESGGDLDNRIKVLFDGLRKPREHKELGNLTPGPDENPFFCLLQDDSLITEVHIITDRLLTPVVTNESQHDVELIIHVKTDQDIVRSSDVEEVRDISKMALSLTPRESIFP